MEVTANTTYDTTSLRRSQARRNYSLNRTNSVREARATTEDRTFGGSRLSRQSSFSERSRWRDAGGGTVNMGLSVVPKADFTSYGRMGRPGYDYAADTTVFLLNYRFPFSGKGHSGLRREPRLGRYILGRNFRKKK